MIEKTTVGKKNLRLLVLTTSLFYPDNGVIL